MPKVTKILGYNKARAWESLGFAHKKRLCQHFDTTSFSITQYLQQISKLYIIVQFSHNGHDTKAE